MPSLSELNASTAVIVTGDDGISATSGCLDVLFEYTPADIEIFVVLTPAPDFVRHELGEAERRRPISVIETDQWCCQNVQRNKGIEAAGPRDYYIFIDNDSRIRPQWAERLVECSATTGADVVSAIHLLGGQVDAGEPGKKVVHMAGGDWIFETDTNGLPSLDEVHFHVDEYLADTLAQTGTQPFETRLVEFHCLLLTASAMEAVGRFDEGMQGGMEHVDLSITLHRAGKRMMIDPKVENTYVGAANLLCDLESYATKWSGEPSVRWLRVFSEKYGLSQESAFFNRQGSWNREHFESIAVVRRAVPEVPPLIDLWDHGAARTWAQLAKQLLRLDWTAEELATTKACFETALRLFDQFYRADGKPFIAHTVGTASLLAAHGAPPVFVNAALVHAAYSTGPLSVAFDAGALAQRRAALIQRIGYNPERIVRNYNDIDWTAVPPPHDAEEIERYPFDRAQALLMQVANDLEDRLDGGLAISSKTTSNYSAVLAHAEAVLPRLGQSALLRDFIAAHDLTESVIQEIPDAVRLPFSQAIYFGNSEIADSIALPDRYWIEVAEFLRRNGLTEDDVAAPGEFVYLCPNMRPMSIDATIASEVDHYVIHKGKLGEIGSDLVHHIAELVPVFANEVFVVFSRQGKRLDPEQEIHLAAFLKSGSAR